jgi:uncharacterized protein YjbI with pentapeptide repeats
MMNPILHENKTFSQINYAEKHLQGREFINCVFEQCDFSKAVIRDTDFMSCIFKECNFTMCHWPGSGLDKAIFAGCKILGVDFTQCNQMMFSPIFDQCYLDYSIFYGLKIRKMQFLRCSLKEVDASYADLTAAVFTGSDLLGMKFISTVLDKADLRDTEHLSLDPELNKMKKARLSMRDLPGLLDKHQLEIGD